MQKILYLFFLLSIVTNCSSADSGKVQPKKEQTTEAKIMEDVNKLFNEKMPEVMGSFTSLNSFRMNILDTPESFHVDAELPGVKKEDININLKGDNLIISGEKKSYQEEKKDQYTKIERSSGSFTRTIPLPPDVDKDKITSRLQDGVLKVDIMKIKGSRPTVDKKIEIL